MITLRLPDGRPATLTLRPDATVLAVGETDVSSYDLCGRPFVLVRGEWTTRRALDGRLLQKRPAGGGVPRLRCVSAAAEGEPLLQQARGEAEAVLNALEAGPGAGEAAPRLRRIVSMDAAALREDAARFARVYRPVGILPPDQYLALLVQVTEGCSWNACTFCSLHRGTRFHVKTPEELAAHLAAVREAFGSGLALRRSLFLGDANALCVAHERLLPLVERVAQAFPELAEAGLHAFLDAWTGQRKDAEQYRAYGRLGLRRVHVGLESGDPALLSWLRKPGAPEDALALVETLHEAGLAVGVVVLLGAGGERFFNAHARHTAELLTRMALGPDDIVYYSELVEHPSLEYARRVAAEGIQPLRRARLREQRLAIEQAFEPAVPARPPRRAIYDLREFVY
jgi:radical SAM superfamily enzyme YgiQ (UPF0313 family)